MTGFLYRTFSKQKSLNSMVKKIRKKQAAHAELDSYQQQFQN